MAGSVGLLGRRGDDEYRVAKFVGGAGILMLTCALILRVVGCVVDVLLIWKSRVGVWVLKMCGFVADVQVQWESGVGVAELRGWCGGLCRADVGGEAVRQWAIVC